MSELSWAQWKSHEPGSVWVNSVQTPSWLSCMGGGDLSIYLVLYLQGISAISVVLTDVRSSCLRAVFTPQSRYYRLCEFHKSSQNIRPFFPQIPRIPHSGVLYGGRTGRDERQFLSFPSSWPFTSEFLYQHCARNAALSGAWILPASQSAQEGSKWVLVTLAVMDSLLLLLFYYQ